jgi:hypothetical protein
VREAFDDGVMDGDDGALTRDQGKIGVHTGREEHAGVGGPYGPGEGEHVPEGTVPVGGRGLRRRRRQVDDVPLNVRRVERKRVEGRRVADADERLVRRVVR